MLASERRTCRVWAFRGDVDLHRWSSEGEVLDGLVFRVLYSGVLARRRTLSQRYSADTADLKSRVDGFAIEWSTISRFSRCWSVSMIEHVWQRLEYFVWFVSVAHAG